MASVITLAGITVWVINKMEEDDSFEFRASDFYRNDHPYFEAQETNPFRKL